MWSKSKEIGELNDCFLGDESSCALLYGQVGLGMSGLEKELCKEFVYYYYKARFASSHEQQIQMKNEVERHFHETIDDECYENIFSTITKNENAPYILIVEHFDRIAKKEPKFMEAVAHLVKGKLGGPKVLVVLCTTNVQWVKKNYIDEGNIRPQYINKWIELNEMHFLDLVRMFPEYPIRDCVEVYGILGGRTELLEQWESRRGFKFNVCKHILSSKGYLYSQVDHYLQGELRELSVYYTILGAIASGHTKLNELYEYTGFSRAKISVYMKNLMAFDVIDKVHSIETGGWVNTKKGVYRIRNTYIDFWFHFIYPNLSALRIESEEDYYTNYIEPKLDAYLEKYFTKVCMEYFDLVNEVGKLPVIVSKMGTWVGKQGNIDIIAQDMSRNNIVGKCSWSAETFTYEMYEELLEMMKMAKISSKYCYLFSARKFDAKLIRESQDNKGIILVDMNQL